MLRKVFSQMKPNQQSKKKVEEKVQEAKVVQKDVAEEDENENTFASFAARVPRKDENTIHNNDTKSKTSLNSSGSKKYENLGK